jgi:hypothetical protein
MPRGGYRVGGGRPKGSGRKATSLVTAAVSANPADILVAPELPPIPPRNSTDPLDLTGISYLQRLVRDEGADVHRRDRAAGLLASIEFRSGKIPTGKKQQAEEAAKLAGWGTEWWGLLHDKNSPTFDPDGLPPDERAVWEAERRKRASKPTEPRQQGIDEILAAREKTLPPWRFSVPGERNDFSVPPDDE